MYDNEKMKFLRDIARTWDSDTINNHLCRASEESKDTNDVNRAENILKKIVQYKINKK